MSLPVITHPVFEVEIPSTKQKVKLRPMLVKEEKILLMAKESGDARDILGAVKQVVQNCLTTKLNVDGLALFDVEYLYIKLRAMSVSNTSKVAYIDNDEVATAMEGLTEQQQRAQAEKIQAAATYEFEVDLDKIEVKFPPKTEKSIKVTDKVGIVMKYPPASLYSDKAFMKTDKSDQVFDMLVVKSIETIYDGDKISDPAKTDEVVLKQWIDNLDVKTYNQIKEFFNTLPTLHYQIDYTNKNGKERKIVLATLNDFFILG